MKFVNHNNSMMTLEQTQNMILQGQNLLIAGSESLLRRLPAGNWVGGTINYFMTTKGGVESHELLQVTELPKDVEAVKIQPYSGASLSQIPQNYFSNGFSFIIIPAFSQTHQTFAKDCSTWSGIFNQPLVGWISGYDLDQQNSKAKVVNGNTLEVISDAAIVMHIKLKTNTIARANIINLFTQGHGDTILFPVNGFDVDNCLVNGAKTNFSQYISDHKIDPHLPLVANYMGAMVNVSIKEIDPVSHNVNLYAPVFEGIEYRFADPIVDYETEFNRTLKDTSEQPIYACNCILNFLYANLKGKKTGDFICAMTFGEIAYMLLNQTLVYVTLDRH